MKRSLFVFALTAGLLAACSDNGDPCDGVICPENAQCNEDHGYCECLDGFRYDGKTNSCKSSDPTVNKCAGVSCSGANQQCDSATGKCACVNGYKFDADGETCVKDDNPSVCTKICKAPYKLNETACECECGGVTCADGSCAASQDACQSSQKGCETRYDCENTELCIGGECTCPSPDYHYNEYGYCAPVDGKMCTVDSYTTKSCETEANCNSPEYEACYNGQCVNKECIGKEWVCGVQKCTITGKVMPYDGMCVEDEDCDTESGESCDKSTNTCIAACQDEPEGNIIPNWDFESWTGNIPSMWGEHNSYFDTGTIEKSDEAKSCTSAVRLINESSNTVRLESDLIEVVGADGYGETFIGSSSNGYNLHYDCSAYVKGKGDFNFGFNAYDEKGEFLDGYKYKYVKSDENIKIDSESFELFEWEDAISAPRTAVSIQPLILFKNTDSSGIVVDRLVCTPKTDHKCGNVVCDNTYLICDINKQKYSTKPGNPDGLDPDWGECVPKDGFCTVYKWEVYKSSTQTTEQREEDTCGSVAKCNTETHRCEPIEGKCVSNRDCSGDTPVCNKSHECVAGDVCEGVKCADWMPCSAENYGACTLAPGRCRNSNDCGKELPLCDPTTHACVAVDTMHSVEKYANCALGWYYDYLNCEDEVVSAKCKKWADDLQCPVNIIPNGDFSAWTDCDAAPDACLSVNGTKYSSPLFWFANYYGEAEGDFDGVNENQYQNELPVNLTDLYEVSADDWAIQIKDTSSKAKRFVSYGFTVPGGTYDCSYWVKGKGDLRFNWWGNRGEASKAERGTAAEFVSIDSNDWIRHTFSMRNAQSGVRLMFYVSNADPDKDYIVIDDVACTRRAY